MPNAATVKRRSAINPRQRFRVRGADEDTGNDLSQPAPVAEGKIIGENGDEAFAVNRSRGWR